MSLTLTGADDGRDSPCDFGAFLLNGNPAHSLATNGALLPEEPEPKPKSVDGPKVEEVEQKPDLTAGAGAPASSTGRKRELEQTGVPETGDPEKADKKPKIEGQTGPLEANDGGETYKKPKIEGMAARSSSAFKR